MVGVDYQPMAKWLSLVIVSTLVLVYGKLVDTFSRDRVFYILTSIYALAAFSFAWAFSNPEIGLQIPCLIQCVSLDGYGMCM